MIGIRIAQYRVVERLGSGSMGVVYRAEDTRLGRSVALKFLPLEVSGDVCAKRRFLREAQAASRLDHPNICTVHEIGETADGRLYIVMAFYRGETLKQRIARGPLPVREALEIAWQIARGLAGAHAERVIHRDVKPANVLIQDDGDGPGRVKVLDFGLAKVAGEAALTQTGSSVGTPLYMSPEQIGGESDERADVWSLGVLLYEMLTGRRPFGGNSSAMAMYQILHQRPAPLAELRPGLTGALQPIVDRALAKEPDERYPTMAELASDLAAAGRSSGGSWPSSSWPPAEAAGPETEVIGSVPRGVWRRRFGRLRPAAPLGLAAAALAAALLLPAAARLAPGFEPAPTALPAVAPAAPRPAAAQAVAVLPFDFHGSPEFAYLADGMVDLLATKLDGAGDLRSVDPRALLGFLKAGGGGDGPRGPGRAAEVSGRFDADLFILGSVVEVAGQLHLDARLYAADGRAAGGELASAAAEGAAEEIFSLIDRLAAQLLAARQRGPASRVARLAAVTTESFAALKAYLDGESAYRDGRFEDARLAFLTAVAADPGFALAWYRLAIVAEWLVDAEGAALAAEKAAQHAGRLADHDRLLVAALAAYSRGDGDHAERLYRDVLRRHPDDVEAWARLGETEFHYGPLDGRSRRRSRASWQRVEAFEPGDVDAQLHLGRLDLYDRDEPRLAERAARIESLAPGGERDAEVLFYRGSLPGGEAARRAIEARVGASSLSLEWMPPAFFSGSSWSDPELWMPTVRRLLAGERSEIERSYARRMLGVLELSLGRLERAERELAAVTLPARAPGEYAAIAATVPFLPMARERVEAVRDAVARWPREVGAGGSPFDPHALMAPHLRAYLSGLLDARLGRPAAALEQAAELDALAPIAATPGLREDLAAGVRAEVARLAGDSAGALTLLGDRRGRYHYQLTVFSPVFSQVRERWLRAEALFDLGRLEEAAGWYESLAEVNLFDLTYLAWSHLRRAEIAERLGRPEDARSHYRRFLELWRHADAGLDPMLERAERALDRLDSV